MNVKKKGMPKNRIPVDSLLLHRTHLQRCAERLSLVYATRFQKSTAQERASSFLAFVVFGAGNTLLFLAV